MVVVDSSALIPLAWVGRLELIPEKFDDIHTTNEVEDEVLTEGKPGTARLATFLEDVRIHDAPANAGAVAELDGIAPADASVILLAEDKGEVLLANDKGLIEVARSHDVECWWVTTLLLSLTKRGTLDADEATDVLYDLVDHGMNLHPKVYARIDRTLRDLGDD
jgi:predicted nucleic acid-binding protein